MAYFDYADIDRDDFNLTLSDEATDAFTSWCSAGATISGTVNPGQTHLNFEALRLRQL